MNSKRRQLERKLTILRGGSSSSSKSTSKTRQERQKFWSDLMDSDENIRDRLKASELLGRSEADFTDKVQGELILTLEEKLKQMRENETVA
jgi:hypothetical protein